MKAKTYSKKFFLIAVAVVMIISQIVTLKPANAAIVLPVAGYVSASGTVQNGAANTATYNGKVTINVPVTNVLTAFETEMQMAAKNGLYPHGREGRNKIAYIEYNITFPETVDIGTITKTNTSSVINGNRIISTVNGRTVNFKLYLNDTNWAGILGYYNADKVNPNAHTVKLEIPYSITANSKDEAKKYENETITGQGEFAFYPSGFMALLKSGIQVFPTDTANVPFLAGLSDSPSFPMELGVNGNLEGDLLIGGETEHDSVHETTKDAIMDFTGTLNVSPIKQELRRLEANFSAAYAAGIKVEDIDSVFETGITLPNGMEFKDANPEVLLSGVNGKFEIISKTLVNNQITVKIGLKNASGITTYSQLANIVDSIDDTLKIRVKGVKFSDSAAANTNHTVTAYIGGNFKAKAISAGNRVINFDYKWLGKQSASGADAIAPNDLSKITYTVKYTIPPEINLGATEDLMGDILIGDKTEHTSVYESTKDASHEFTGVLNVKPIKDKMIQIEAAYNNTLNHHVTIDEVDATFTTSLELPEEMAFSSTTPTAKLEGDKGIFKITNIQKTGNKVTVTIKLAKTYTDSYELSRDIKSVEDELKVKVSGVVFTAAAKPNTNYTVKGELNGKFTGNAMMNATGRVVKFNFKWNGKQMPEGADAIAPNNLDKLTFTLRYNSMSTPALPPAPNKPDKPVVSPVSNGYNVPIKPNTGDNSNLTLYLVTAGCAALAFVCIVAYRKKKKK